ncbi:MAG: FAD-binding protein [Prevotella sp.]|nr:FAD-binding protein [Alistipes senegalensis]MCM1358616.1 FAD-binding protein [Prevotella sp.]MCM1472679.1 FAD-binding protein [Muribaculaceae bacterium]
MLRINNIRVPLDFDFSELENLCLKKLKISSGNLVSVRLAKKSVDARKKTDVHFIISLDIEVKNEEKVLKTVKNAVKTEKFIYNPEKLSGNFRRPVVVGFGSAGMFAALVLAMSGACPLVLERGSDVDSRRMTVENFRSGGALNPECNVQFGEGGAGTFSDGKLTTGIKNKRIDWILEKFVEFGAPEEILYLAKAHIGTDKLLKVVKNIRTEITRLGGEVIFNAKFCDFQVQNDHISEVTYSDGESLHTIKTNNLILASGHSARDVFELLNNKKISLSAKNFSVGVRIEHPRRDIDRDMYGDFAGHKALKSADYKLVAHLQNGRTLYTFCMCPGGEVIAASSEENGLVVNGMSCFARNAENSNSALLVGISPEDFGSSDVLAGMCFQREIEEKAFIAGGSDYSAPITLVGDFLEGKLSEKLGEIIPSYRPAVKFARPEEYLPDFVCETLRKGIIEMGKKIKSFNNPSAILTGVETRSSSPVRVNRGENFQSLSLKGLFPCGEGAGYAGGIMSAAVDGMQCAESVIENLKGE